MITLLLLLAQFQIPFPGTGASGPPTPSNYLFIDTVGVGALATGTTSNVDTSGSSIIFLEVSGGLSVVPTPSDSKSNTWIALNTNTGNGSTFNNTLYYCKPCIVGTGHNFSFTGATSAGSIIAAWFSGGMQAFDLQGADNVFGTNTSPAIVPNNNNEIVITGDIPQNVNATGVTPGWTVALIIPFVGGNNFSSGFAYQIQTTAASAQAVWAPPGISAVSISAFQ